MYKDRKKKEEEGHIATKSEDTEKASEGPSPPPSTPLKAHHSIDSSGEENDDDEEEEASFEIEIDILGEDSSESEMDCAGHLIILTPAAEKKKPKTKEKTPKGDHRMHDAPSLGQLLQSAVEIPVFRPVADYDVPPLPHRGAKKSLQATPDPSSDEVRSPFRPLFSRSHVSLDLGQRVC